MKAVICSLLAAVLVPVFAYQDVRAQKLYTWTDKEGVVHITTSPTEAEMIKANKAKIVRKKAEASQAQGRKKQANKDERDYIRESETRQKEAAEAYKKTVRDAKEVLDTLYPNR